MVEIQEAGAAVGVGVARNIHIVGRVGCVAIPAENVVVLAGAVNGAGIIEILTERKLRDGATLGAERGCLAPGARLRTAAQGTHTDCVLGVGLQAVQVSLGKGSGAVRGPLRVGSRLVFDLPGRLRTNRHPRNIGGVVRHIGGSHRVRSDTAARIAIGETERVDNAQHVT